MRSPEGEQTIATLAMQAEMFRHRGIEIPEDMQRVLDRAATLPGGLQGVSERAREQQRVAYERESSQGAERARAMIQKVIDLPEIQALLAAQEQYDADLDAFFDTPEVVAFCDAQDEKVKSAPTEEAREAIRAQAHEQLRTMFNQRNGGK